MFGTCRTCRSTTTKNNRGKRKIMKPERDQTYFLSLYFIFSYCSFSLHKKMPFTMRDQSNKQRSEIEKLYKGLVGERVRASNKNINTKQKWVHQWPLWLQLCLS